MKSPALVKEQEEVDRLFVTIASASSDPYLQSLLTYYLCVRVSGFVENCIRIVCSEYSTPRSKDKVSSFVNRGLERLPNPTYSNLCKVLKQFDDSWVQALKPNVTEQMRHSLETINVNRNAIAHGGTSTITIAQLAGYYSDAVQVVEAMETVCT